MSHQGLEGWFPECFICGGGNLNGVICMTPLVDEEHGFQPIRGEMSGISELRHEDGHSWKRCLLCPTQMVSDPFSWGSYAYCIECWNDFASRGVYPPTSASRARRLTPEEWGAGE
jgi:hypothetical protein